VGTALTGNKKGGNGWQEQQANESWVSHECGAASEL